MRVCGIFLSLFAGPIFAIATMAQAPQAGPDVIRLGAPVTSIALSGNSRRVAVVSRDNKLTLWDLSDGRLLRTIPLATAEIDITALSDDGRWIFAGDHSGNALVWDANTGEAKLQLQLPHYPSAACFSRDGKIIAIAPMGEPVQVFDMAAAKMLFQTHAVTGGSEALALSRDGKSLATADADTAVRVYDARSGKLSAENHDFLLEPLAVEFSPDGRQVIAGGGDKFLIFIDAASGKTIRRLEKTDEPYSSLKVSSDGAFVAAILMKAENMTQPAPLVKWEVSSGQKKSQWTPRVLALGMDWTPDGRLISAGAEGDSLQIWRVP
jgi:WD40 repeat protein